MPNLYASLRDQDLGFLNIIASFWGVTIPRRDTETARKALVSEIIDRELVEEMAAALPAPAAAALSELLQSTGRLPWVRLVRQHGDVRQMGRARRDREKPYEDAPSAVEMLYYRGLVARAYMDSPDGMQEYAYIPDDLLPLIPVSEPLLELALGRPAADQDCVQVLAAGDRILDDATTMLAGLRAEADYSRYILKACAPFLYELLQAAGLIEETGELDVEVVRVFLEHPRGETLAALARTWITSPGLSDLHLVPTLEAEGAWRNDPLETRRRVLDFIASVPDGAWWSINGFISAIKDRFPEFQRPDGDYDSWFLKDLATGEYQRGAAHWDQVEGALLRFLIVGPLHWLGIVDLASARALKSKEPPPDGWAMAFRLTRWARHLMKGIPIEKLAEEDQKVHVRSDGRINVPRLAPRAARYLLARFCDWEAPVWDEYRYRPTPSSLVAAAEHGLNVGQLIALLARHTDGIPPNITRSLKNWQVQGVAARIETFPVLRLPAPEALSALRASRAARYLGDTLGPAAVALKPGTEQRVLAVLSELGYLGEIIETH